LSCRKVIPTCLPNLLVVVSDPTNNGWIAMLKVWGEGAAKLVNLHTDHVTIWSELRYITVADVERLRWWVCGPNTCPVGIVQGLGLLILIQTARMEVNRIKSQIWSVNLEQLLILPILLETLYISEVHQQKVENVF
jgi:hypothetical protein